MPRVAQGELDVVFQDVPNRLPVDAGGLHRHVRDAMSGQPVTQSQQPRDSGRELGHLRPTDPYLIRHPHAGRDLRLMHVKRADTLKDRLHRGS
jgi:hypothetical protein